MYCANPIGARDSVDNRHVYNIEIFSALSQLKVGHSDAYHFVQVYSDLIEDGFRSGVSPEETARKIVRTALPSYSQHYAIENPGAMISDRDRKLLVKFADGKPLASKTLDELPPEVRRCMRRWLRLGLIDDATRPYYVMPKRFRLTEEGRNAIAQQNPNDIANIPMYRGASGWDPKKLRGPSYFSSSEVFAKTYGPTAEFRLSPKRPLIVSNDEWPEYASTPYNPIEDIVRKLKESGYDAAINIRKSPVGLLYTVLLVDPTHAKLVPHIENPFAFSRPAKVALVLSGISAAIALGLYLATGSSSSTGQTVLYKNFTIATRPTIVGSTKLWAAEFTWRKQVVQMLAPTEDLAISEAKRTIDTYVTT